MYINIHWIIRLEIHCIHFLVENTVNNQTLYLHGIDRWARLYLIPGMHKLWHIACICIW